MKWKSKKESNPKENFIHTIPIIHNIHTYIYNKKVINQAYKIATDKNLDDDDVDDDDDTLEGYTIIHHLHQTFQEINKQSIQLFLIPVCFLSFLCSLVLVVIAL